MIALLDANVLIALFDAAHSHHLAAHRWMAQHRRSGWATCPLTQNACVRVISQPGYPGRLAVADMARRLRDAISAADHHFWPDDLSLVDPERFILDRILTSRPLTDLYLLALATARHGCLVTFDQGIPCDAVRGATARNLVILGA